MERKEEERVSKHNRRNKQEAGLSAQVYNPSLPYIDRQLSRKERDKKLNLLIKKARKKRK